ncbi:MAG: hypothetical protein ACJAYN_002792 [Bermanella sp.]
MVIWKLSHFRDRKKGLAVKRLMPGFLFISRVKDGFNLIRPTIIFPLSTISQLHGDVIMVMFHHYEEGGVKNQKLKVSVDVSRIETARTRLIPKKALSESICHSLWRSIFTYST